MSRKWENCLKLDQLSWGYRRDIKVKFLIYLKLKIFIIINTYLG